MGVKCPFCQTENDNGVIFCYQCGTEIISTGIRDKSVYRSTYQVDLKDIMKFTLKKVFLIAIMMFIMILFAMVLTANF